MKNTPKQTELQKLLTCYNCPECDAKQLITKPYPKEDKNGGCSILKSVVTCLKCGSKRKVTRYPNGTYRSFINK